MGINNQIESILKIYMKYLGAKGFPFIFLFQKAFSNFP